MRALLGPLILSAALAFEPASLLGVTTVCGLRCEQLETPLGIDAPQPCLNWRIESERRGVAQAAYQIEVATSESRLRSGHPDLWDSGKVASSETVGARYSGAPLASRQHCFWKVRMWDQDGKPAESAVASWEMGLLNPADWQAKWIGRTTDPSVGAAPLLRRSFVIPGAVKQARAYVCGLGYFELYLNGRRVGDHLLDPGYTRYDRRALYVTHDITALLRPGANTLGALLGNGWFNVSNHAAWDFDKAPWRAAPKLLLQVEIEFNDGARAVIASDGSWKASDSPLVANTIYSGEVYDARREQAKWDESEFNDSSWPAALEVEPPKGRLSAQTMPPIRVDRTLEPVAITEPKPGLFVFDFGQNLSGHARLSVEGPRGATVSMKYAERLASDGRVDQADIGQHVLRFGSNQVFQTDSYILKGGGQETWSSRFTYHGFRYVELSGFPGKPTKEALRAVFFHSAVPVTGRFTCSNPLLNRIWEAARWSYLGNLQGIPTDCPHREKNGWTGDAHLAAEQAMFNYFPGAVYAKWLNDLADEQQPDGRLPGIVPTSGWGYSWGNGPAWDSALLLIPYYQYVYYGDVGSFRRHYENMKRYVDYLGARAKEGVVNIGLNDWAPFDTQTGAAITDTAYYYVDTRIVALAATVLGRADDARRYSEAASRIRQSFQDKFYHPETGLYDNGSQTALSCALYQGLVPAEHRDQVVSNLVAAVAARHGHIDTGILGAKYLLNTLTDNGRADIAYQIASQKDLPSWGWWMEQGATTLWEEWRGGASRFHIMYGDISAWFYKTLAGIAPDPAAPGFKHFLVSPHVVGDLTSAGAEYDSIRGRIASQWRLAEGVFTLDLIVPANTTATVTLPIADPETVKEGGKPAARAPGVLSLRRESGRSLMEVQSGVYHFQGPLAGPDRPATLPTGRF